MVDREPAYQLSIVDDEAQVTSVQMTRDEFTVGRKEGSVIRLTERNVSRAHSRVVRENGRFYVSDLGSYNGTKVNGRRIRGKVPLSAGDEIGIGDYVLRIEAVEGAAISAPPPVEVSKAPQVTVVVGGVPGAVHHLTDVPHVIGRGEEASIRIDDQSVSRVHAKLSLLQGRYFIEDARAGAGADAGLLVSGRRVRTKALDPGDIVDIGPAQIYFTLGSLAAEEIRPPASPKRASRLPMFAGIGALLAAVVGAAIVFGRGGDDPAGRVAGREGGAGPSAVGVPAVTDVEPSGPAQPAADHVEPAAAADPQPPGPDDGPSADEALAAARDAADKASSVEDWDGVLDMLQAKSLAASHEAAVIRAEAERERDARK
ncbi:MAG: FHA domain-containing protein, partial [Myxococcota bacterium]|nr:FHA domain-containing protein [Myxococcota bacterium]